LYTTLFFINPSLKIATLVTFTFDFEMAGAVEWELEQTSFEYDPYPVIDNMDYYHGIRIALEILIIFYYTVLATVELKNNKRKKNKLQNVLSYILIVSFICAAIFWITTVIYLYASKFEHLFVSTKNLLIDTEVLFNAMSNYVTLSILRLVYQILLSIIVILWALKYVFYFCNWNSFKLIVKTLKATIVPLSALYCFYLLLFVSIAGLLTFTAGSEMKEASHYFTSFVLTVRYLNDEFDYEHLEEYINGFLVFIFYCFVLFGITFVVFNIFIAIILDIYAEKKAMIDAKKKYKVNHIRELWYAFKHVDLYEIIDSLPIDMDELESITQDDLERKFGVTKDIAALVIKEFGMPEISN